MLEHNVQLFSLNAQSEEDGGADLEPGSPGPKPPPAPATLSRYRAKGNGVIPPPQHDSAIPRTLHIMTILP